MGPHPHAVGSWGDVLQTPLTPDFSLFVGAWENRADSEVFQQRGGAVKALTPKTRPFCDRQVGEL